jgi:nitrogen PTS system EIIA component
MDLRDLLTPAAIVPALKADDKRQVLVELSEVAARITGLKSRDVFAALWQRERLGSTGMGRGIAIPHGRMPDVKRMTCIFARLETPVAFDSHDAEPVDLIFLLLAPEHAGADHLKALARISRLMREPETAEKLRASKDSGSIYAVLTEPVARPQLSRAG